MDANRKHIVIVDDNPVNLDFSERVLQEKYKVTKLISGEQLLKFLTRVRPDMILLDIQMPGISGYEVLRRIRQDPAVETIPVIFITGQQDAGSEREGFRLGAQDFIVKPFDREVMLARVRAQLELYQYRNELEELVRRKTRRIEELQHTITAGWAEMIESRDGTTGSHIRNTTRYFSCFLRILAADARFAPQLPHDALDDLARASTVHDVGKIGISDHVLKKPGPLTREEFEDMKAHSRIGAQMIQKIIDHSQEDAFLHYAKEMALSHHERWDGTGYPSGLRGEEIPLYVRVLSIVDVYDALTSVRPYKKAFTHEEALECMREECGKFFCPVLFSVFLAHDAQIRKILESKKTENEGAISGERLRDDS